MKKSFWFKTNNSGATLITVILSIAFVAILGTIIISASVTNMEMKAVDEKHKRNFYSVEAALDEIKIGLQETVADQIANSYEYVLKQYSSTNEAKRQSLFITSFTDGLKTRLQVSDLDRSVSFLVISNYLKETKKDNLTQNGAEIELVPTFDDTTKDNCFIYLKNLKVIYTLDGFTESIKTDIKVDIPTLAFDMYVANGESMYYSDYALIADKSLLAEFSSHDIEGNVYAGTEGITVSQENTLQISGDKIITAGDIIVKDKGEFIVNDPEVGESDTEVWATNLITTQSDKRENRTLDTTIQITGKSYIKDDLLLEAKKSKVELTGEYYGYSNGIGPKNNSAIMINAINASLNLEKLNKLILAGRAFLSFNNTQISFDIDNNYGATVGSNGAIQTGESLTLKGSQNAYLLPERFITVGHNPVSWTEYTNYYDNEYEDMISIPSDAVIFANTAISYDESKLMYYLDEVTPVKTIFYKFDTNNNAVYFYLNFKSDKLATTYFKNYKICYPDKVYNGYPVSEIKINDDIGAVITVGNLFTFDGNLNVVEGNNGDYLNNFGVHYTNLTRTLQKNITGSTSVYDYIINRDRVIKTGENYAGQAMFMDGDYYINIMDNNSFGSTLTHNQRGKKGIIIATGDIEIYSDFEGLIISGGRITLYNGANIKSNPTLIRDILNENANVRKYFNEFAGNSETGSLNNMETLDITELLVFENWTKE